MQLSTGPTATAADLSFIVFHSVEEGSLACLI